MNRDARWPRSTARLARRARSVGRSALPGTIKVCPEHFVPMRKNAMNEPGDKTLRDPGLEGQLIDQHNRRWIGRTRNDAPLMSPQLHGAHRGLLDKPLAGIDFQQGQVRIVDGKNAEQKDVAAKHTDAGPNLYVPQGSNSSWKRHSKERPHFRGDTIERCNPFPHASGRSAQPGLKTQRNSATPHASS